MFVSRGLCPLLQPNVPEHSLHMSLCERGPLSLPGRLPWWAVLLFRIQGPSQTPLHRRPLRGPGWTHTSEGPGRESWKVEEDGGLWF